MLPVEIEADTGALLGELTELGFRVVEARYEAKSFGNYYIDLVGPICAFRITRDRGQYLIDADVDRLKNLGMFRAFTDKEELRTAIRSYLHSMA